MTSSSTAFDSEGFDLDAVADADASLGDNGAVLEIGGGCSSAAGTPAKSTTNDTTGEEPDPLKEANELKQRGNAAFAAKEWLESIDLYTEAISKANAVATFTGQDLLDDQTAWQQAENERLRMQAMESARQQTSSKKKTDGDNETTTSTKHDDVEGNDDDDKDDDNTEKPPPFVPRTHPYGATLAVYHSNRAAAYHYLQDFNAACHDCDMAILLNPRYAKAYLRRSAAHEALEQTDKALQDAKSALKLTTNPSSVVAVRKTVARLQKLEDERMERLKEETMDKLKDLGNSILGNFGLSLDNFQANQDPNTGSYSIAFNQK